MTNKKLFLGLAALALLSACNADKITQANNNPNDPTDAPSTALFTNAARNSTRWLDGVGGTRYGFLPQHLAEVQYPDDDAYLSARLGASATSGLFNASYNVELQDLRLIIDRGTTASQPGLWAPAQILSQWEFGVLTDVYGDVPYSQAFDPTVLKPAYDPQQQIYDGLFTSLNAAADALASATNELGTSDPIYRGNPAQWRMFANSLRLRHALRLANVNRAKAGTEITAALAAGEGGVILSNADNAALAWPGDGIYDNPWANNFKGRDDHRISIRFMTFMRDYKDPRVAVLAMPAEVDQPEIAGRTLRYCPSGSPPCYVGLMNALTQTQAAPLSAYTSRPGEIFYPGTTAYGNFGGSGKTWPSLYMTAAEVEFILAEAAERGIGTVTGTAAQHYLNGITRHFEMLGLDPALAATYAAQPLVAYVPGATQQNLIRIATQKWIALYTDPIQAWSDVRRTCQPAIVEPGPTARFAVIPRRFQYSTTEKAVNKTQYETAVTRQWTTLGGDVMTNRFYWDALTGWQTSPTFQPGCSDRRS